jgi:hypothetical protein
MEKSKPVQDKHVWFVVAKATTNQTSASRNSGISIEITRIFQTTKRLAIF